jgi:hypothetical protein
MAAWKVSLPSFPPNNLHTICICWLKTLQAAKISKEYEAQGGEYENEAGSKNKPVKGPPQKKTEKEKSDEMKSGSKKRKSDVSVAKEDDEHDEEDADEAEDKEEKAKPNTGKKRGRPASNGSGAKKQKVEKPKREGTRKSSRSAGKSEDKPVYNQDDAEDDEDEDVEEKDEPKKKVAAASQAKSKAGRKPKGKWILLAFLSAWVVYYFFTALEVWSVGFRAHVGAGPCRFRALGLYGVDYIMTIRVVSLVPRDE